ncbi:MAG: aspartyl protease family protein [Candidatus Thorarchaeota archaeon]
MPSEKTYSRRKRLKIVCKYRTFREEDGTAYRLPMIFVYLEHKGISFRTPVLVDSGATCSFIPLELAETLELLMEEEDSARGAGGVIPIFVSNVNIAIFEGPQALLRVP